MQRICTFSQMIDRLKEAAGKRRVAVVCPYDECTIEALERALSDGVADLILVGDNRVEEVAKQLKGHGEVRTRIVEGDIDATAIAAVDLIRNGEADVLMKGLINTDNYLRAILNKEHGLLPKGRLLTHLSVAQLPGYHKLLFFSDVAVIPYPTLAQREEMIGYDLDTCRRMGIDTPKVALIHFTEKVNPKFPNSVDYATLVEEASQGKFGNVAMAGPMDAKTACDSHSAEVKGLTSPVCGDADLLIFPNIESGNTFYKTITLFGGAVIAGMLQGTIAPVVLPSRSDTAESKFLSLALACMNA